MDPATQASCGGAGGKRNLVVRRGAAAQTRSVDCGGARGALADP
jgi:hypothetical protein